MNEYSLESALRDLLCGEPLEDTALAEPCRDVCTYAEGGYLTYDRGLVVTTADGSEFQLTIRQTR